MASAPVAACETDNDGHEVAADSATDTGCPCAGADVSGEIEMRVGVEGFVESGTYRGVELVDEDGNYLRQRLKPPTSDFLFEDVPAGRYDLTVYVPGDAPDWAYIYCNGFAEDLDVCSEDVHVAVVVDHCEGDYLPPG